MTIYSNTAYPKKSTDLKGVEEDFSVDVITHSKDGMLNIGYWNYDTKDWAFHTDTLIDPYEKGELMEFVWMYQPPELAMMFDESLNSEE